MIRSRPRKIRSHEAEPAAMRAPIFRFKPELEPFIEETSRAVAQLPD